MIESGGGEIAPHFAHASFETAVTQLTAHSLINRLKPINSLQNVNI